MWYKDKHKFLKTKFFLKKIKKKGCVFVFFCSTKFGNSLAGNYIPISLTIIRIILGTIVLTFINIINVIEIKKIFSNN